MKKFISYLLIVVLVMLPCISMFSCDFLIDSESNTVENTSSKNVKVIRDSTFKESNNKYKIVDSFIMDDGCYYYFYHIGTIDYVPLNTYNAEGVYFNGNDVTLEFKMTTTYKDESIREIKSAINNSVELKTESFVQGSVSSNLFGVVEAKAELGISNNATNSVSNTMSESYSMAVSNQSLYEKTITYTMDKNDPVGFYFYTPVASVKVYEIVVYNPSTEKIECMSTYNQFGAAIPGLFYSEYSFIDFGEYEIIFDESQITSFDKPSSYVSSDITIPIDANGGICEVSEWSGKIGQTYDTLPVVEKNGYKFMGWYADGIKITNDSIAIVSDAITAKWELLTSCSYQTSGSVSVNASHKLNPFGLIFMGTSEEETASFDKILNNFDLATLKNEGYRMRITLEYDVKRSKLAAFGLDYNISMKSNGKNIAEFSESIDSSDFVFKRNVSNLINLNDVTGSLVMEVSTKNIFDVTITNMVIKIDFIK